MRPEHFGTRYHERGREFLMSDDDSLDYLHAAKAREGKGFRWLALGLAISLGLNAYLFIRADHQARDVAGLEQRLQNEITRLSDATSAAFDVDQQRFSEMKGALGNPAARPQAAAEGQPGAAATTSVAPSKPVAKPSPFAKPEVRASAVTTPESKPAPEPKPRQEAKAVDPNAILRASSVQMNTMAAKPVPSTPVPSSAPKPDLPAPAMAAAAPPAPKPNVMPVAKAQPVVEAPASRPTARPEPVAQREKFDFDLIKDKAGQTFGDVRIALAKADLKRNTFTLEVFADGKLVQKKDQAPNERIEVPIAGSSQPCEIVIWQVKRDEVVGSITLQRAASDHVASKTTSGE